jgi:cytochrome o ubiquinol oxidase operon protein cyoD
MTVSRYVTGFVLSLLLTLSTYGIVVSGASGVWLVPTLGVLALVQMIVQLIFFLHLGEEAKPRWRILSFLFMAGALTIIVAGSIWIMANLNYNMMNMTPDEKENYMLKEYDKGF